MPEYSFTLVEHDTVRPWIVLSQEQRTATLEAGVNFFEWAAEQWPAPRWKCELDPWQLGQAWLPRET